MSRNNSDLTLFSEIASNSFLAAIILVALFVTLLYRRDSIVSVSLFRLGCILYVFSIMGGDVCDSMGLDRRPILFRARH